MGGMDIDLEDFVASVHGLNVSFDESSEETAPLLSKGIAGG
jgi:hypothetical protein